MKTYDVVVIGAGDVGLSVAFKASAEGFKVALIDKGKPGGTCVNNGCVPSKTLIYTADRIVESSNDLKLGINSEITYIDFKVVMERMRGIVASGRNSLKDAIKGDDNIDFINKECHFLDEYTLDAGVNKIKGKKIFIASGARPSLPPIKGLKDIKYLTNESVLSLERKPESMIFIGGGYIALEYAHFFAALGVKVYIIDRNKSFLSFGEPEVSELLKKEMEKRTELYMGFDIAEVKNSDSGYTVIVKDTATGQEREISADAVMVAAGRTSNADILKPENAGIEMDKANFIKVDDYLGTNKKHIWAIGDAIGKAMFTHAGDKEAEIAWHNATQKQKIRMNFELLPYAVYTYPQIASIGLTEQQAAKDYDIQVGRAMYSDTVMGEAMAEVDGFAKAIVEKETGKILGFHIIGPHAAILIQEVVNAVINGHDYKTITGSMHIFPALSNIITDTFDNLE